MGEPGEWREMAACIEAPSDVFFPNREHGVGEVRNPSRRQRQLDRARMWCDGCPVVEDCAAYAIGNGITDGIWGGQWATKLHRQRRVEAVGWRSRSE